MGRDLDPGTQAIAISAPQQVVQRTLAPLERQIDDAIAAKLPTIDIALSEVQLIDSAGLNWLLSVLGRLQTLDMKLRLIDPSPIMVDVLLATRLDSRFAVVFAKAKALGAADGRG